MKKKLIMTMMVLFAAASVAACGGSGAKSPTESAEAESEIKEESSDAKTDAQTGKDLASGDISESSDAGSGEDDKSTDISYILSHGMVLENEEADLSSLSTEQIDWGMGPDRDDLGRPVTAMNFQEEYGKYGVNFIDPSGDKVIYLTFDSGYENGYTDTILDTLKEKDVTGVFFITGYYAQTEEDHVRRMIDEGHILGNHTQNHPSDGMSAHSIEYQTKEVMESQEYVKEHYDYDMYLFRYPSGNFNIQSLALMNNLGFRTLFWSSAYTDWDPENQMDHEEALSLLKEKLHPGAIYLLHAVSETNAAILGDFIDYVREEGYEIKSPLYLVMD